MDMILGEKQTPFSYDIHWKSKLVESTKQSLVCVLAILPCHNTQYRIKKKRKAESN